MAHEISAGNKHIVCQYKDKIATFGIWMHRNPLNYALPLFLLQLSVISITSLLIEICLQPLGQSSIVSQILGGILFGPSLLGHPRIMGTALFPARSITTLQTLASWGIMYFLFAVGVRTDTDMMVRPGRRPLVLGICAMTITFFFSISMALILKQYVIMDSTLAKALPYMASAQCMTAFSNVSCLLIELKMANSDLGRIAAATAMLCDFVGIIILVIIISLKGSGSDPIKFLLSLSSSFLLALLLVYIVRPMIKRTVKRIPTGKPLASRYVLMCFVGVLLTGLTTEVIGQHFAVGPMVLGFIVPDGPPLGSQIISKLDLPVGKFLYPTFLTTSGLKTNIFMIDLRSLWIVAFLIFFCCIVKVLTIVAASRFLNIYFYDSVVIGLMLNARGICEILMYNLWKQTGILTDQEFALSVISVIGVTAIITPLIKLLYDPSKHHLPKSMRTIQHSKRDMELRILVCIHNQDNVPSIINLLEVSHATEQTPIAVISVLLEELVDRATQMLVSHQTTRMLQPNNSRSSHIIKALRQYQHYNTRSVSVQSFTTISHLLMVHDDISRIAFDQDATLLILPFHKHWEIDGSIGSVNKSIQHMNFKIMEKSPCSVAILVDRGILKGSLSILNNQSVYRVAVIYIGGPDDAESLFYGARMAGHPNVTLTIIWFLLPGCDNARERKLDNMLIDEVRHANMENQNFMYQEQVVRDAVGLASCLGGLEKRFDLVIVGRHHQESVILTGLGAWSECPELGVVGDFLSSPDLRSTTSVLVVQQQRFDRVMKRATETYVSEESVNGLKPAGNKWDFA